MENVKTIKVDELMKMLGGGFIAPCPRCDTPSCQLDVTEVVNYWCDNCYDGFSLTEEEVIDMNR
jgi:hypothetical protein